MPCYNPPLFSLVLLEPYRFSFPPVKKSELRLLFGYAYFRTYSDNLITFTGYDIDLG
jgi:hypothetical protein